MLRKEVILTTFGYPRLGIHHTMTTLHATLPYIRVVLEVTCSFSASSCFLTFLTKNLPSESCSLLLMPFSLSTVACSWFDECLLHLFPLSFQARTRKSLYFVQGGSSTCQLTPWLISMLPGTTSTPVNILLAAHPDMDIGESLSLPGNSEARSDAGHSQNNIQSSQE